MRVLNFSRRLGREKTYRFGRTRQNADPIFLESSSQYLDSPTWMDGPIANDALGHVLASLRSADSTLHRQVLTQ